MEHERELVLRLKQMALLVGGAAIANKYDPAQPRVPAGNPDGGQWTDGGAGADGAARAGRRERPAYVSEQEGRSSFTLVSRRRDAGSVETNRWRSSDGVEIVASERRLCFAGPAFTRHEVRDTEGAGLTVETARGVQRILDGDGNLLAATRWGDNGPEPVRLAYLDGKPKLRVGGRLGLLLGALSELLGSLDDSPVAVGFEAGEYVADPERGYALTLVRKVSGKKSGAPASATDRFWREQSYRMPYCGRSDCLQPCMGPRCIQRSQNG